MHKLLYKTHEVASHSCEGLPRTFGRAYPKMMLGKTNSPKGVGFTLVEMVISLAILTLIVGMGVPTTIGFFQRQSVTAERDTLVSLLRRARTEAMTNRSESAHGLFIDTSSYIIYQGNAYDARVAMYDEVFPRGGGITVATTTDINFSALSGDASSSVTLAVSQSTKTVTITINTEGSIY